MKLLLGLCTCADNAYLSEGNVRSMYCADNVCLSEVTVMSMYVC